MTLNKQQLNTYYNQIFNTPEAQAVRQAFKQNAQAKRLAQRNAPKVARPSKPVSTETPKTRTPFKGAGKK